MLMSSHQYDNKIQDQIQVVFAAAAVNLHVLPVSTLLSLEAQSNRLVARFLSNVNIRREQFIVKVRLEQ